MSAFDSLANVAETTIDDTFADSGTYTPVSGSAFTCDAILSVGNQLLVGNGFQYELSDDVTHLSFRVSDVPQPKRGDTFAVNGTTYTILEKSSEDAWRTTWTVR